MAGVGPSSSDTKGWVGAVVDGSSVTDLPSAVKKAVLLLNVENPFAGSLDCGFGYLYKALPIKKLNRVFRTVSMEVFYFTPGLVNAATVAVFIAAQVPVGVRFVAVNFVILLWLK